MNDILFMYESDLINLIRCAFDGNTVPKLHSGYSLDTLYNLSRYHGITNILYLPLSKIVNDKEKLDRFRLTYLMKMQLNELQTIYVDKITEEFEKNEIAHCVMKGPVIKSLYPRTDFRQSTDIDIYIDSKKREETRQIMEKMGFSIVRYDIEDADDVYEKNDLHVELHRKLISDKTPWQNECQKIIGRLLVKDGTKFSYEMSLEDYYLYMIAHMAKHMLYSGMGIKMILDVWVYMNVYYNTLDWDVLKQRLQKCGLYKFEESVRKLTDYWFNDFEAEDIIKKMGRYIIISGAYGTMEQFVVTDYALRMEGTENVLFARIITAFKMTFLPCKFMRIKYPILKKAPILLPFCWIDRIIKAIGKKETRDMVENLNEIDAKELENSKKLLEFKKEIGL